MSGVLGDMGLALIRLSKYEEEGGMELARYTHATASVKAVEILNEISKSGSV